MNNVTVFIGGIIQGSRMDASTHPQDYRQRLKTTIRKYCPTWEIADPVEMHPESDSYDSVTSIKTFKELVEAAAKSDLLVAYLPEASMGTALEMWECNCAGVPVICITQMVRNWVVQATSTVVLSSLQQFENFAQDGNLHKIVAARRSTGETLASKS